MHEGFVMPPFFKGGITGYFRRFRSNTSSAILPSSCADVFFRI